MKILNNNYKTIFMKPMIYIAAIILMAMDLEAQDLLTILPVNKNTNKIEFSEVVNVEGKPSELYTRAIAWINSFFKNASDVTKVKDESNGIIEGKHRIRIMNKIEEGVENLFGYVQYEFKLEFKEGRYRYTIYNFVFMDASKQALEKWLNPKDPSHTINTVSHLEQVDLFVKDLIKSLKQGMKPKEVIKDDW